MLRHHFTSTDVKGKGEQADVTVPGWLSLRHGLRLSWISPYSPNLNLIERLWKHVKSRLRSKYYDQFDDFKETIDAIIEDTSKRSKKLIDKLTGNSAQIFDTLVPINENSFVVDSVSKDKTENVA
ncbi:MAG: transposase [Oscillospiraceae bacterium]|nr:transposase [Oscillospiraceae bacterium]